MNVTHFALRYPLFVLKTGESSFVTCDLRRAVPRRTARTGIPVFTIEERAVDYLRSLDFEATVKRYDQEHLFRRFLRSLVETEYLICFDPRILGHRRVQVENAFPAGLVLEQFTRDPGWGWQFPLFAIYCRGFYATLKVRYSSDDNRYRDVPREMAIVLTDADLADREIMAYHVAQGGVAVRFADTTEFADFVRRLPADVDGVIFDPPTQRGDHKTNQGCLRDQLLQILCATI